MTSSEATTTRSDSLVIGYLHPGTVSHSFHQSMRDVMFHDLRHEQRIVAVIGEECGTARVIDGRNKVVEQFLNQTDAQWLGFVDSDMGFDGDMFDRLLRAAHPKDRPIVGALAFGQKNAGDGPQKSLKFMPVPTIYRWVDTEQQAGVYPVLNYERNTLVKCDATGGSNFVVHRSVLEAIAEQDWQYPRVWFDDTIYKGRVIGEDLTFFLRARELGFPTHVHTGVRTSHHKQHYLTEESVGDLAACPTFVAIPMKDKADLTAALVDQLREQDGHDHIFIYDNGSETDDAHVWLEEQATRPDVTVVNAAGAGIHRMWNDALTRAKNLSSGRHNVAILNNDITIGDRFLGGLSEALRSDPMIAIVGPNYDGRDLEGLQDVDDICAGRYDGTGGLPGFAFMLRGEAGYRFPEALNWWYGDNDMVLTARTSGARVCIVGDVTVKHVDGGGQTGGDWSSKKALIDADREWFQAKWRKLLDAA